MDSKRNYQIPDPVIGFYATGLFGMSPEEKDIVQSILTPVSQYFDMNEEPHVTCRYLGYKDEVDFDRIEKIIPEIKKIYDKYLPVECEIEHLIAGWDNHPDYKPRLVMAKVKSQSLLSIHNELMSLTQSFPVFSLVEGEMYAPHFTLGGLKKEFEDDVPNAVTEFLKNMKIEPIKIYLRTPYIHAKGESGYVSI